MATAPINALRTSGVNRTFSTILTVSLAVHVSVLAVYAWLDSRNQEEIELPDEPIKAVMVRLGKPRDPKLLKRIDTAPPPAPKEKAVAVPIKDAKPVEKTVD